MPGITPFRQFQDELYEAPAPASRGGGTRNLAAPVASAQGQAASPAEQSAEILEYLRSTYSNLDVSNSFADAAGEVVDCVRLTQQPALRGGPIASPPAFIEMEGAATARSIEAAPASPPLAEGRKDQFGNDVYCPPGFVPVIRVTPERLRGMGGATQFFQKAPGGGKHPSLGSGSDAEVTARGIGEGGPAVPMQMVGGAIHAYAHASQWVAGQQCIGARSWLNLWTPNPSPGVFSLSQQWIAGDDGRGVQTIEGGWHVYPGLYNDPQPLTRLFLYWTADGYRTTGAYNLTTRPGQGGFVQVDNTWVIGGSFKASVAGGDQQGFLMQWQRDPANGNWWLYLQGTGQAVAVGYYPAALYGSGPLSQAAMSVDFGGEVCGQPNARATGPMGSGQPASAGWQRAAFHKQIAYLTPSGWKSATLTPDQRDGPAYTIDLKNNTSSPWGTYFYYGGPGATF